MGKAIRLNVWIALCLTHSFEGDTCARSLSNLRDTAPLRRKFTDAGYMLLRADDRHVFQTLFIKRQLPRKARQRIGSALDLKAVNAAIDDRNIDAHLGVRKAKLVDDESVVATVKGAQLFTVQSRADFGVS